MSQSQLELWNDWKTEDLAQMGQFIIQGSTPFLQSQGWMYMVNLNDGYLYTRSAANHADHSPPLGQQVGDMRVKFQYVACDEVNVMA